MAACSFDYQFLYVAYGWEGSASDMTVLRWATQNGGFKVPEGRYFLVDSGYANTNYCIAPYRGCRYHIGEYAGNRTYSSPQDRFNHRHAQLRNCIEKAFGILKMRFSILTSPTRYPVSSQGKIVLACCILHNFIRRTNGDDEYFTRSIENDIQEMDTDDVDNEAFVGANETQQGVVLRNSIRDMLTGDS